MVFYISQHLKIKVPPRQNPGAATNNTLISECVQIRDLGLLVDSNLSFVYHVKAVCANILHF